MKDRKHRKRDRPANAAAEAKRWFETSVTCEGEPYVMDLEQAAAVVDDGPNTIVVARAGSGKTRTLVAKIIYLVAKCGILPSEIMAFVFNANAAAEINLRLSSMLVNGQRIIPESAHIARTFHAFARHIVYDVCNQRDRSSGILASEKDAFVLEIVKLMLSSDPWKNKIRAFIEGNPETLPSPKSLAPTEIAKFASMMSQFINRAQQKFLCSDTSLPDFATQYLNSHEIIDRERAFIELGCEAYRRYHQHLCDANHQIPRFEQFGTDFNLLIAEACRLIGEQPSAIKALLATKKYLLIDEYQDFSQLFLSAIKAIRAVTPAAKLFVVGDDWQAINRFAGSDVDYFQHFEHYFPEGATRLEISTNYRCHYQIVDTARKFMAKAMREKGHFKAFSKKAGEVILVNPRATPLSFALVDHDRRVSDEDRLYRHITDRMHRKLSKKTTVQYIKTLLRIIAENPDASQILILHRNNETKLQEISLEALGRGLKWGAKQLGLRDAENFASRVSLMTMHRSKGLEADVVIILEADDSIIPRVHPDTRLYEMFGETPDVVLDDQKRLFYVAMTRAKKRLYIIHIPAKDKNANGFIPFLGHGLSKWREDD